VIWWKVGGEHITGTGFGGRIYATAFLIQRTTRVTPSADDLEGLLGAECSKDRGGLIDEILKSSTN
jgi:hypothetical protein